MTGTSNDCDCCGGLAATTPVEVHNRPGLSAMAYRVGTHSAFLSTMLSRLSGGALRGTSVGQAQAIRARLSALRSRTTDDFAIALLDAWATVADVSTFYNERIANESYLRTATERRSLLELARLLGYRPRPGLAAATQLAFTVEREMVIDAGTRVQSVPASGEQPQTFETSEPLAARPAWNAIRPCLFAPSIVDASASRLVVTGSSTGLRRGDALVITEAGTTPVLRWVSAVWPDAQLRQTTLDLQPGPIVLELAGERPPAGVLALPGRASLHGHNAPDWRVMPWEIRQATPDASDWPNPPPPGSNAPDLSLASLYPDWVAGGWVVVIRGGRGILAHIGATSEETVQLHTVSATVTQLTLHAPEAVPTTMADLRSTRVYGGSVELHLADVALADPIRAGEATLELDDYQPLPAGRHIIVNGIEESGGTPRSEPAIVAGVEFNPAARVTRLLLQAGLTRQYQRDSVTINANVVRATHGEAEREVLGGGDPSRPFQRLSLRRAPVTHVRGGTDGNGAASTLDICVDGVRWHEAPWLFGRGPTERVFVTETTESGRVSVRFGDGSTGARPASGAENVVATYRHGLGRAGNVDAGRLTRALTGPPGIREVTNPLPASGGADPDDVTALRANAPRTVLTLGRIVSLRDYEDFALGYAGVAKALATWTWQGSRRVILLTVAGAGGAPILAAGLGGLWNAIRGNADPGVPVHLASYQPVTFALGARVRVKPDFDAAAVLDAVARRLRERFAFAERRFAQSVTLSEVVAAMHELPAVVAVDVDRFGRTDATLLDEPGLVYPRLFAYGPQWTDVGLVPAELLTIDNDALELTELP